VSSRGLDISVREYEDHFSEEHVPHSNALHSILRGHGSYFVGPMARYSLNFDRFPPLVREAARDAGLGPVVQNPFQSIVVRSLELLYACDEALRIIETYEPPPAPFVAVQPRAATGYGASEAPRGILFHRYRLDATGAIADAKIVPPTSQNQRAIEEDLRGFVESHLELPSDQLTWQCEQAIRNYDPCISCATHFLKLELDREVERPC
jgi:coenzyme F420-reducing hydrogenase alpha subunit